MKPGVKLAGLIVIPFVLSACGGGSEDSSSNNEASKQTDISSLSPEALKQQYMAYVAQRFTGKTSMATLESEPEAVQRYASMLMGSEIIFWPLPPDEFYSQIFYGDLKLPAKVSTEYYCRRGGSFSVQGSLDSNGTGNFQFNYNSCHSDLPFVLNGHSAVSMTAPDGSAAVVYYDNMSIAFDGSKTERLTGFVSYLVTDGGQGLEIEENLLAIDSITGQQKLDQALRTYSGNQEDFEGTLWLSEYGGVRLSTDVPVNTSVAPPMGKLLFAGAAKQTASLEFVQADFTRFLLDTTGDSLPDVGYYFDSMDAFFNADFANIQLVAVDDLGFPPVAGPPLLITETPDTTTDIEVAAGFYTDKDTDENDLDVSYQWTINNVAVPDQVSNILPAGIAHKDDVVEVRLIVSDGRFETVSSPLGLTIGDAPGTMTVTAIPDRILVGDTLVFTANYVDPDLPEGQPASLVYGPSGMSVGADGTVEWSVDTALFDQSTVSFGLTGGDGDELFEYNVVVDAPAASLPIARSGITLPSTNHAMFITDFMGGMDNEIVSMDANRIFALRNNDGQYKEVWAYPYAMPTQGLVKAISVHDLDDDGKSEIVVATEHGLSIILNESERALPIWETERYIKAIDVDDLDFNGDPEIAVLSSESNYSSNDQSLTVLSVSATVDQVFETSLNGTANELVIGNVDLDNQLEIILNSGFIYDGETFANQWYRAAGFSNGSLTVGDLDGDGIDEIAAADSWDEIKVFSAASKSLLYTMDNFNTCSLHAANVDQDPSLELIVGDCQWGDVKAYDWQSASLQSAWAVDAQDHGTKSVTVGDADNDGLPEVIWGTGISSSGASLIVADISDTTPVIAAGTGASVQLDRFSAAGWGDLQPNDERAVFIIPKTQSSYGGQRLAYMTQDGSFLLTNEIESNWDKALYGAVTDYNRDGYADIFLATANLYNGMFKVLQLDSLVEYWSTEPSYESNVGMIAAVDVNDDQFTDALFVDGKAISIVDIHNEVLLDKITSSSGIQDFDYIDATSLNERYLAVATQNSNLEIWRDEGTSFELSSSQVTPCGRVQFANIDSDSEPELVCSTTSYVSVPSEIITFELENGVLSESKRFLADGKVTDFVVDRTHPNFQTLLMGIENVADYRYPIRQVVSTSPQAGKTIWASPPLLGTITHRSMHYRPEVADDRDRLMFATNRAMYLVR